MEVTGTIRKMEAVQAARVEYHLPFRDHSVGMNRLIGKRIEMEYLGKIHCIRCGRETSRSFAQGYCYPCFMTAPETEECVLRPELCRAHEGFARDMEYARDHCLIEHVVYLSNTSGLKVGVTRNTQVPTRWIDQGAVAAIELARTPNRFLAGRMEVAMKSHISDKTNWRQMLTGSSGGEVDLVAEKRKLAPLFPQDLQGYISPDDRITRINYPVEQYPQKVRSLNFDKEACIEGTLTGIKGQYLLFEDNGVVNLRKYGGYLVRLSIPD
jgi:hypothetical protein